jgi:hypothetical protein
MQMVDEAVAAAGGQRVVPVAVTGEIQSDVERIRIAADGGAQMAFDMVGGCARSRYDSRSAWQSFSRRATCADGEHDGSSPNSLH